MLNAEPDAAPVDDLSTLSWVHDELRRSLESATKSLRRHLKEAEALAGSDVDSVDPAVLRTARAQIHQGVGALEMIGLPGPARVLRASEAVVQRLVARPKLLNAAAVEAVESASFGVLDYLGRKLAGKGLPTLALFPQYSRLQQLAGADRVHPADLWREDWQWRSLPADTSVAPRPADEGTRGMMEAQVLAIMRGPDRAAMARLSDLCAALGEAAEGRLADLWRLAAAFYEAQAAGLLQPDVYAKRVSSRLLAQLRLALAGQREVSDRLAQDLLFFCAHAQAPDDAHLAPRLAAVREPYAVDDSATFDYLAVRLGRFDPALIAQARKRVAGARDLWAAVSGGEPHRGGGLAEQFALVGDSLKRLYPSGEILADALQRAVAQTLASGAAPPPSLAMEVATSVLYLDASLEDGEFDHPLVAGRVQRLAQRIRQVGEGRDAQPLEPWMEELYRRVSDRQTMGSVVQELRASLSEIEKEIDRYFRDPAQRELLIPVPSQLQAMRGVLSVLDLDQASQAVLRMRDDVDMLSQIEVDPQRSAHQPTFDRLADNLGALSFMIDMLSVQPQMARGLFAFDPAEGRLKALMGRRSQRLSAFGGFDETPKAGLVDEARSLAQAAAQDAVPDDALKLGLQRLSQQALLADQRRLAEKMVSAQAALERAGDDAERQAARAGLAQAVAELAAPELAPEAPAAPPTAVRVTPAPSAVGDTGLEEDDEMRAIFIEEAREVLHDADAALGRLAHAPEALDDLTAIRRAFHTLKGSSRMVGLKDFGEAAWACEQLYNARLAERPRLEPDLRQFTARAFTELGRWVDAVEAAAPVPVDGAALAAAAEALRGLAPADAEAAPAAVPPPADEAVRSAAGAALRERVPQLPSAEDLRLDLDLPASAGPAPVSDLGFTLDLGEAPSAEAPAAGARVDADFELDFGRAPVPAGASALPELAELADMADFEEAVRIAADAASAGPAFADTTIEGAGRPDVAPDEADSAAVTEPMMLALDAEPAEEPVRVVGDLRIPIPLFNIYLNEADELSRRLCTELAEWGLEWPHRPVGEGTIALAHSLAGSSATVGYAELSALARSLEHALAHAQHHGAAGAGEADLFREVAEEIRRLLHQFAAGFLRPASPDLRQRLEQHEHAPRTPAAAAGTRDFGSAAGRAAPGQPADPVGTEAAAVNAADDTARAGADEPAADLAEPVSAPAETTPGAGSVAAGVGPEPPVPVRPEAPAVAENPDVPALGEVALTEFSALPMAAAPRVSADAFDDEQDIDATDQIDEELFPIFREEGEELLPQLQARMRDWAHRPGDGAAAAACMRTLHTFKGGARLAGAMRLGEMTHRLEAAVEHLLARGPVEAADVEALLGRVDTLATSFEQLGQPAGQAPVASPPEGSAMRPAALPPAALEPPAPLPAAPALRPASAAGPDRGAIDWARFRAGAATGVPQLAADKPSGNLAAVRVRAPLLDRLVNQAGEVSITRARIESDVGQIKGSLADLTENLERLRRQLRDLELQAESQIASRLEAAKAAAQEFDPLEMDRFTRFQELTRMMAESVNDVATVHRGLQRSLQATEDELASQARLTRDLQDDLLRTRMVEFESLADRLYRVVRQAAKETAKQVRLDIVGGSIEVDRGVLERMTGPFEHLLRNGVAHGIEPPAQRTAAGKDAAGTITISLAQEGNEVAVEFRDDGAGLDLARIRARGVALGLLAPEAKPSDAELAGLIFHPGFSTAANVSELAGRGVGMDVVRAEVNAMGGRIETATAAGQGASFRLVLPLTTAVTQVVMLRSGERRVAVPSTLVEQVRRVPAAEVERAYAAGGFPAGDQVLPFFWLGALLQGGPAGALDGRTQAVVIVRSAAQRIALHVDEVVGNQEVVVKNLGPQLSRLPGLAGVTLLPSGAVALIYNPVALATTYGEAARARQHPAGPGDTAPVTAATTPARSPLVLVVDDSLTVRRVTQRLLAREGYRVALAKDGLDALEKLAEELPAVVLSDIEMPRMDGFDLVLNMRSDPRQASLPVIMITSRFAQKHRDRAAELGVNHFLGKPYSEEELLALVARYVQETATA